jgi:flagellar protein FlgJ
MRVTTASLASDGRSLDALRHGAQKDPEGAVRAAASQFEALFMQMVLKSMRDAVPKSGMFDGPGADVYRSMLDTQFAQALSGRPGGLGELIARQLSRNLRAADGADAAATPGVSADGLQRALAAALRTDEPGDADEPGAGPAFPPAGALVAAAVTRARAEALAARAQAPAEPRAEPRAEPGAPRAAGAPAAFVDRMWDAAHHAQALTGVPAGFIVGQAALETGWGRQEIRHPDGRSAHNLFGIKAGPGWRGDAVEATTTEYVDGRPVRTVERFRAYASYQDAFADWARLISGNPRYAGVMRAGDSAEGFARQLQQAGYATDPDYAGKLSRTINQALALRRAGA